MDLIDKLVNLVDEVDPRSFLPELNTILGWIELISKLLLLLPPILLLGFGLWYRFKPPKEANHFIGYRFYLGMGSVDAWKFTQRLAGIVWTILGGVLLLVMVIVTFSMGGSDVESILSTATAWLIVQLILSAGSCIAINVVVGIRYDKKGELRAQVRQRRAQELELDYAPEYPQDKT